ncbi:CYTH domain-containing protein [Kingella kingae]|uniref:CYTH domain-containing protein n=1 Tax=Kingella kingae TaxID=504 RepID=UPI000310EC0C|nr:CYTH domain-containing protein [Kingella kingae]MDK4544423.1 CYTH domain-containing protein [Kingella kingae]MDK4555245.1 CYTH domain-containing protein [Kingella kingae]MDK4566330.1 CYTH domain-containing protein [Kingella kingae]MDK4589499.1 CYTH domain-containing protein [Kingella kingae]MDK4596441.1 CYTH domain-containing protein [Kingella kingae]
MSTLEIERRFLLRDDSWREHASAPQVLQQGYISVEKECTIRVRVAGNRAWLTLKGYISDVSRHEFEYEIPLADAQTMLATVCPFKIEKHRYIVEHEGFVFEIDEFFGDNAPLIVAELELPSEDTAYAKPDWLGEEITSDGRFTNAYLSKHPFGSWS